MYQVEISSRALADIEQAFLFIRKEAPTRADAWLEGMIAAIYSLEEMPNRCAKAPESHELGVEIRQLLYGKRPGVYRVLFMLAGDVARVLHVRHGARKSLEADDIEGLGEEGIQLH